MQEKIIKDSILEEMTLENVFKLFNSNIYPMLKDEDIQFCEELENFCLELHPKIDKSQDVYSLMPELGKYGYMQRIHQYKDFTPFGIKKEFLLATIIAICDPQLEFARISSGNLCGNPTFHHGKTEEIFKVQEELMTGKAIGSICITEPDKGSDAVNLNTTCTKTDDGIIFNGEKIFTTNGPKAKYFISYGVYDTENPRDTMVQAMVSRDFGGVVTNRLKINAVPRVHIAHTILNNVKVPMEYILGDNGEGYRNLFGGLIPERLGLMGSSLGRSWAALIYGLIYTNLRKQFGKPIIQHQGVGFKLAELLSKNTAAASLALQATTIYDEKILFAEKPSKEAEKWVAGVSSQGKYFVAKLSHETCYEVQQQMGGISITDNTPLDELIDVSKTEEFIGGARNIQLLIIQGGLRRIMNTL
ncbi:MAG: acyl-CoA dehydrogenase family protein [Candidatus Odinarchaeota archaeon]